VCSMTTFFHFSQMFFNDHFIVSWVGSGRKEGAEEGTKNCHSSQKFRGERVKRVRGGVGVRDKNTRRGMQKNTSSSFSRFCLPFHRIRVRFVSVLILVILVTLLLILVMLDFPN
jgi:hypothetical protein